MKVLKAMLVLVALLSPIILSASGPVGVYGVIEKVVFEPNEQSPVRVQHWGAFAFADGAAGGNQVSEIRRGYMYFGTNGPPTAAVVTEWKDLKAVAGTGQAVGFGLWQYTGPFENLKPSAPPDNLPHMYALFSGGGSEFVDMRVRPANETPGKPALYQTNSGIVKLPDSGSHAEIVKQLRAAVK